MNEHLPGSDEDWEPSEDMIAWAKEHFANIGIGGAWSPDGSGCTYVRKSENTWSLARIMDHPTATSHHIRFKTLFKLADLEILEGEAIHFPPPKSPEEGAKQRFDEKREIALNWRCECELPLAEFDLTKRTDVFIEDKEVQLSNGDTSPVQIWACRITCPSCENEVEVDPDDYHLLAGDELFLQWGDREGGTYKAQTRMEICDLADAGIMGVALGKMLMGTDEKVPPWMWGTYCVYHPSGL